MQMCDGRIWIRNGTEVFQENDLNSPEFQEVLKSSGYYSYMAAKGWHVTGNTAAIESTEETSTDNEMVDDTVDPEAVKVMFFSMVGEDVGENETVDDFSSEIDMVKRTVDTTDVTDETGVLDETSFQTFGAPSQDDEMMETTSFPGTTFNFDIDQNGSVSRLDAEMLIGYLSDFFRSEDFAAFAQSDSSEMLQMDVDGDAQLTPLDALIVINELNRSGALEANVSNGSRLAANSTLMVGDDKRVRDTSDDFGADVSVS